MNIITLKTGAEKYANRIYTTYFYLLQRGGGEPIPLTEHGSYMPHEQIICGLNGCFGQWEIGHVTLPDGARIMGVLTRKILAYDPHYENQLTHYIIQAKFKLPGRKDRQYTRNNWGYNGGEKNSKLLTGRFDLEDEQKKEWPVTTTPLSKIPF